MNVLKISLATFTASALLAAVYWLYPSDITPVKTPVVKPFGNSQALPSVPAAAPAPLASVDAPSKSIAHPLELVAATTPLKMAKRPSKERRFEEALELEKRRTADPALGYVPRERLITALEQTRRRQEELLSSGYYDSRGPNNIANGRWKERGPNNVGGRTRALLVDLNDPERKTIYAGSASGGLWRTRDITAPDIQWEAINEFWARLAIGALAQDPLNPQYIYVGTGEYTDVRGFGIVRSSDGGNTWTLLSSTNNGFFQTTQAIVVHPITGHVYAATNDALYRSKDHGDTWEKVLSSFKHDVDVTPDGILYSGGASNFYRSDTGDFGDWENLNAKPGFPTELQRVEASVCAAQPEVVYVVGAISGGRGSAVYKSTNGGESWTVKDQPGGDGDGNYARNQAWYDLDIACSPLDPDNVYLGGIDLFHSTNGGTSFSRVSNWAGGAPQYVHADQHVIIFDPDSNDKAYYGNDGGVWRVDNAAALIPTFVERNTEGYNVTQFYYGAMHPGFLSGYFLAGSQDNGSNQLNDPDISPSREVVGGDGFLCFIDQNEPNIQFASLYFGDFYLSTDGGINFSAGVNTDAGFLTPAAYDSEANILYADTYTLNGFCRFHVNTNVPEFVTVNNASLNTSHFAVDPNISNRIYVGSYNGDLYYADNAHTGLTINFTQIGNFSGSVSSVDIEKGNSNHLLVTLSNYGINSIWESTDGGLNWINCDGPSLPDMPVRWGVFNPNDADQAMIATEAGVWITDNLNGTATQWIPPVPGRGIPMVRTDMLQVRASDKVVMAATYGRGVWTTGVFSDPYPVAAYEQVSYRNAEILFRGDRSIGDETYFWNLGDGTTSSEMNIAHSYPDIGTYPITFTLNGDISHNGAVKILPDLPLPYGVAEGVDAGGFEGFDEQFGIARLGGSFFEKGSSTWPGKSGTHTGDNAIVLGLNEQYYQPNTHAMLYLSNFDFSDQGIYEFSFWGRWSIQPGNDGFNIEYSEDKGMTWHILGGEADDWYTFTVPPGFISAFTSGTPIFTSSTSSQWRQKKINVSHFAGKPNIAFRIVFKSESTGNFSGVALDDFKITKYDGELQTQVTQFTGGFAGSTDILLNWTTYPEYNCKRFHIERSENGRDFAELEAGSPQFATGVNSIVEQYYEFEDYGLAKLYYYRLHVINENPDIPYAYDFYTPIVVVRQQIEGVGINRVFPNAFTDHIEVTFNDIVNGPVHFTLFDAAGRLILQETHALSGVYTSINMPRAIADGTYALQIQIGEGDPQTVKLVRASE